MGTCPLTLEEAQKAGLKELFNKLGSSEKGLSAAEADQRLKQYGYNEIAEKKTNPLLKFLGYFWGPILWMIEKESIPIERSVEAGGVSDFQFPAGRAAGPKEFPSGFPGGFCQRRKE